MSTYAQIIDGMVVNTIVADADFIATQTEKTYVICNKGGIGWTFDGTNFVAPQPYPSWILDKNFDWQPPTPKPDNILTWIWNETTLSWEH